MKRRIGKILGIAIGQKSILIAEVNSKGTSCAVTKLAEFAYPEGLSIEAPAKLGAALGEFLHKQQIGTREAVIGLPAKRLLTRRKEVPPAPAEMAASTLRLQTEGDFVTAGGETEELVMDFAGQTSEKEASAVLVIATTRAFVDQCTEMARAAGLKVRGVTATPIALGRATSQIPGGDGLVMSLSAGACELIVQHGDSPSQLRHLNVGEVNTPESLGMLVGEIRRTVAGLNRNGTPLSLAVWQSDQADGGPSSNVLEQRLGMPVTSPNLRTMVTTEAVGGNAYAPAVAVGLAGLETDGLPIDFLHSRLAPPAAKRNLRPLTWLLIGVGAAAVLILAGVIDLQLLQKSLADKKQRYTSISDDYIQARSDFDRLRFVRDFAPHKPRAVACMKELTALFPDEGSIWATSMTLHTATPTGSQGELSGRAASQAQVLNLLAKMQSSKQFAGTRRIEWHANPANGEGESTEGTFIINFIYHGTE